MMNKSSPSNYSESLLIKENTVVSTGEKHLEKSHFLFRCNSFKIL